MTQIINPTIFADSTTAVGDELGWWNPSKDETGNGTTTLYDQAGSANGTLGNFPSPPTSPPNASGWIADTTSGGVRAIKGDGTNDEIKIATGPCNDAFRNGLWAISAWLKCDTTPIPIGTDPWAVGTSGTTLDFLHFLTNNASGSQARFQLNTNGGSPGNIVLKSPLYDWSVWNHVVWLMDASGVKFYRNGVQETLTVDTGPNQQVTFAAGKLNQLALLFLWRSTSGLWFPGRVDDVRVFDGLTAGEISTLASGRG